MERNSNNEKSDGNAFQPLQQIKIGELLQNNTRFRILMYLRMNELLSFSDIAHLTGKSRSTVHHHLQKLIEGGLIREVKTQGLRDQFSPKFYELVPAPKRVFDFSKISGLPLDEQVSAFLTTTKLHQRSVFYLYQLLALFSDYLDNIEELITAGKDQADLEDLHEMLEGESGTVSYDHYALRFNEIYYYSIKVSEHVYQEYRRELERVYERIFELIEREKKQGMTKVEPYFIYHLSAPLGKQYLVKPSSNGEIKKKVR